MNEVHYLVTGFVAGFVITSLVWISFISNRIKKMHERLVEYMEGR